jgi:Asp/Glu/hydantoin racemase
MQSILVIQPNSTQSMTDALKPLVDSLQFKDVNQYRSQYRYSN